MHINPTIWWILGLVFVYIFGLIEGRNQGYKRREKEESQEAKEKPLVPIQPVATKMDDPGLMRIKNENGSLTLDLDGARVEPTALNPDQRKRLIEILTNIRPWLEGKSASPVPVTSTLPSAEARPLEQAPSESAPVPTGTTPQSRPQPSAPKTATASNADDRPVAPANSIVGQIDSILQAQLAGTLLAEQGIFMTQSPEGGVLVYIGLNKYNGVDEVPDADIKAAIRAATAEWEKKYTPGLQ